MKTTLYVASAVILGFAVVALPTLFFLVQAGPDRESSQDTFFSGESRSTWALDQNHVEMVSTRDLEILGISFFVASVVYILSRRKETKRDITWPLSRKL